MNHPMMPFLVYPYNSLHVRALHILSQIRLSEDTQLVCLPSCSGFLRFLKCCEFV